MSQFDFPHINFFGRSVIDVATGNNNYHFPLVTFDPIHSTVVLPPRIILDAKTIITILDNPDLDIFRENIQNAGDGHSYIEISPIDTPELFEEWNCKPLGSHPADKYYQPLYRHILTKNESKPLEGCCPGYWNYYGSMLFSFEDVKVNSIQTSSESVYTEGSEICPEEIRALLGSELTMSDPRGRHSAVMIDVSPTLSIYSQVFCDHLRLYNEKQTFMSGKPFKASLRMMNSKRVVNQPGIQAASGSFFSSIPLVSLDGKEESPLIKFFKKYQTRPWKIEGVFIRYNVFETFEDQSPDYDKIGKTGNPARTSILGSLTPWYEGELRSHSMGRLLYPEMPFAGKITLPSIIANVDEKNEYLSLDLSGAIPLQNLTISDPILDPNQYPHSYETFPLGELKVCVKLSKKEIMEIGRIKVDPFNLSREVFIKSGGMKDILIPEAIRLHPAFPGSAEIHIYGPPASDMEAHQDDLLLSKETNYMIATDQVGIYANSGDTPSEGYVSYGYPKEPCIFRVFHRGLPFPGKLAMTIHEYRMGSFGAGYTQKEFATIRDFQDGYRIDFPADLPANLLYAFIPAEGEIIPSNLLYLMLRTGAFVNMRVINNPDYNNYLDPDHPDYTRDIPFEFIFTEILRISALIYPVSSIITPFNQEYFMKIRRYLRVLISEEKWDSFLYMPSSRDMSDNKRKLLLKWLDEEEI